MLGSVDRLDGRWKYSQRRGWSVTRRVALSRKFVVPTMRKDRFAPDPETIARLKELSGLSDQDVKKVAELGRLVHLPDSWSLILETTPADAAYYILDGEVSVRRGGEEVATVGPGTFIGEAAIMNHQIRSAAVITKTNVTALNFTPEAGRELTAAIPAIREAISTADAERVADNTAE